MKKLQTQLLSISKALTDLAKQCKTVSKQLTKASAPAPKKKAPAKSKAKAPAKSKAKAPAKSKAKAPAKAKPAKKAAPKKAAAGQVAPVLETVMGVIKKSRKGVSMGGLKEKTGLESRQVSNAIYKLTKRGEITSKSRGVYVKK